MRLTAIPITKALQILLMGCLALSCRGLCRGDENPTIQFDGNAAFTTDQITDELGCNPDYLLACCTNQSAQSMAPLLQRLLTNGYKASGFPRVSVSTDIQVVDSAPQKILVTIAEGVQIKLGQVHVDGVEEPVAELIRKQLTEPRPEGEVFPTFVLVDGKEQLIWKTPDGQDADTEDPHWKIGSQANFHWSVPRISKSIASELEALGYIDTVFESSIDVQEADGVVDLNVNIQRLGHVRKAERILVRGIYGGQEQDLLKFIELSEGDPCDTARLQTIVRKLWESGRFTKHTARWHSEDKGCLVIDVDKMNGVPWLNEPLSQTALTILKMRQWLSGLAVSDQDLSLEYGDAAGELQIIISSKGIYAKAVKRPEPDAQDASSESITLAVDSAGIFFDYEPLSQVLSIPLNASAGHLDLTLKLGCAQVNAFALPDDNSKPDYFLTKLGFLASSTRRADQNTVGWTLILNPVDWLPLAYRPDLDFHFDDRYLTITDASDPDGERTMVIDKQSGEAVRFDWDGAHTALGAGLFDTARNSVSHKPNAFDMARPISSALLFANQACFWDFYQMASEGSLNEDLRTALDKILQANSLAALDHLAGSAVLAAKTAKFSIPLSDDVPRDRSVGLLFAYLPPELSTFFPKDSWPRKVATTQALLALGQRANTSSIIDSLLGDPANGPVCHALLAWCLKYNLHGRTSEVAGHGLSLLDAAHVAKDLQVLNTYLPAAWIEPPMNALRSLSAEETQAINELLPYPQVSDFLTQIQDSPQVSINSFWQAIGVAQGSFLQDTLRELKAFKPAHLNDTEHMAFESKQPIELGEDEQRKAGQQMLKR